MTSCKYYVLQSEYNFSSILNVGSIGSKGSTSIYLVTSGWLRIILTVVSRRHCEERSTAAIRARRIQ